MKRNDHGRSRRRAPLVLGAAMLLALPLAAAAQSAGEAHGGIIEEQTFLYFLFGGGGTIGVACTAPILVMSMAALAMIVEHLITIRRGVIIPRGLAEEVHALVANQTFAQAQQQCKIRPSYLSFVILAGLQEIDHGYTAAEKAMEDAAQSQAARIFRKIEFLSVIANIATMLGLFGTVVGLVMAFKQVADTQGVARASDLAGGIYLALMTTVEGLIIAIPSVLAYSMFKHRAESLVGDATTMAEYAFAGYRRERLVRRNSESPRPVETPRILRTGTGG